MKRMNHAASLDVKICGQRLPLNCLYGKDKVSVWYCTDFQPSKTGSIEIYRFIDNGWTLSHERSNTTAYIIAEAQKLGIKRVLYPKEVRRILARKAAEKREMADLAGNKSVVLKYKSGRLSSRDYENRHDSDYGNIKLDLWEKVVSHCL